MQGNVKRYGINSNRSKLVKQGTVTVQSNHVTKILVKAFCNKCQKEGMAYEDPNSVFSKPHLCSNCLAKKNKSRG